MSEIVIHLATSSETEQVNKLVNPKDYVTEGLSKVLSTV